PCGATSKDSNSSAARPRGLTQRGAAPLDFPTSPVAGMRGKNFPHIPVPRVDGTPPASRVRLRRHPHPVPSLRSRLRPPVPPLTPLPAKLPPLVSLLVDGGSRGIGAA